MSPKSLLRHKDATSSLEDLANGSFMPVIGDQNSLDPKKVKRVVLCGGKVYYDLAAKRNEQGLEDTAIVRIEQLYPFPEEDLETELAQYTNLEQAVWCQEEPQNQGAWYSSQHHMRNVLAKLNGDLANQLKFAGRPASAAPACGYASVHVEQQNKLVQDALGA
jgi:2-oxoglutarate dehydrogenase E1 component